MADSFQLGEVPTGERLSITINNSRPVELGQLTDSFRALASAHARFADEHGATINGDLVRLFVREIKTGSIIVDLVALAQTLPMWPEHIATIVGFAKSLVGVLKFFKGDDEPEPVWLKVRDARDISQFIAPIANDTRSSLQINAKSGANIQVTYNINSNDANAIQNRTANWIAQNGEPVHGVQKGQLFYFFQARDDSQATVGDRGIIESISPAPVKTIFASEEAKQATLNEALFRKAYVVDVDVQTISGKPRLYKILAVNDSIDRE